ncbi:TPA: amino acid adenylation domain-containing protein, partial [Vibrio cholerae O1]
MIAVLACFKAGGAYVPIDPAYPLARRQYMLEDARPVVLIGSRAVLADLPVSAALNVLDVQGDAARIAQHARDNLAVGALGLTPRHLAYVIYTSGSSGNPKGVMLEHRGLVSLACAERERLGLGADSRVLQFASFSFDACVWEYAMAWSAGASLHLASREDLLPGAALVATLQRCRISHALLAPVVLSALPDDTRLPDLQVLLVGGEACSQALVERWAEGRRMFNAYGPTEATICVSLHECRAGEPGAPPIGRALANTRLYLLDDYGQPVPPGVAGEIHVAGLGLARGYLHRPGLTSERFIVSHLADAGERLYRTGDLGRWNAQGEIEYLGRNDHQVKLRGLRIELGEIEAALRGVNGVRAAVVLAPGQGSQQALLAWVTLEEGASLDAERARAALRTSLPDYMLPTRIVPLAELPLTANGKLDRQRLLQMDGLGLPIIGQPAHQHVALQGEFEEALAQL